MRIDFESIQAYCIHLRNRTDRFDKMNEQLYSFFNENQICIFDGTFNKIGKIGVRESFKNVIREAIKNKLPYVLILEDDVLFQSKKSKEQFLKCIGDLPDDWDIFIGGSYSYKMKERYNDNIVKLKSFSSLHFTLINSTIYDKILKFEDNMHLDTYLGILSKENKINAYLADPMFAIQWMSKSDTKGGVFINYSHMLKNYNVLK